MLLLDASELMDNPGKVMREVAEFVHLEPNINESHFYFDEEKGFYCMRPPEESERGSFCLANDKGRSKNAQVLENVNEKSHVSVITVVFVIPWYDFVNFCITTLALISQSNLKLTGIR